MSSVLPDTYHFRVRGSSVTRERLNQLTTSCQYRFNFTWLSWRKLKFSHITRLFLCQLDVDWLSSTSSSLSLIFLSCTKDPAVLVLLCRAGKSMWLLEGVPSLPPACPSLLSCDPLDKCDPRGDCSYLSYSWCTEEPASIVRVCIRVHVWN